MVSQKAKHIIEQTINQVCKLLGFPSFPFLIVYEKIGQGHFFNTVIGAEIDSDRYTLYVNEDWANNVVNKDQYDLSFIIAHEFRHFYQNTQINLFKAGMPHKEENALILSWIENIKHYQRNEGGVTTRIYHRQPVEIDADAFACFYVMTYRKGQPRIPDDSEDLVTQRLIEIAKQNNHPIDTTE